MNCFFVLRGPIYRSFLLVKNNITIISNRGYINISRLCIRNIRLD